MGAQSNLDAGGEPGELGNVRVTGAKEVLLTEMTQRRAGFRGDLRKIVDDQPDSGAGCNRQNHFGHPSHLLRRGALGPELDQVRSAVAKLSSHAVGSSAAKEGRINESVKPAVGQSAHGLKG